MKIIDVSKMSDEEYAKYVDRILKALQENDKKSLFHIQDEYFRKSSVRNTPSE